MKLGLPIKNQQQIKDYWQKSNSKFKKRFSKLDINLNVDVTLKDKSRINKKAFMNKLKRTLSKEKNEDLDI